MAKTNSRAQQSKLQEEITLCCRKLRLSGNLAEVAVSLGGKPYQEYLLKVLSAEVEWRSEARISKLLNTAGFPKRYEVEQFNASEVLFPDDVSLEDILNLSFYHKGRNLIMYGQTGTGKTMLSILIGMSACKQGISVKFFRTAALVNMLAEGKTHSSLSVLKKKLDSAQILILDEFGYVPYDRMGSQLLFDYISEIHEKKPIIINTNLEFAQWTNVLYDEGMTTALVGRLTHHCDLILFPGGNNRLRESKLFEAYTKMAAKQASASQSS